MEKQFSTPNMLTVLRARLERWFGAVKEWLLRHVDYCVLLSLWCSTAWSYSIYLRAPDELFYRSKLAPARAACSDQFADLPTSRTASALHNATGVVQKGMSFDLATSTASYLGTRY